MESRGRAGRTVKLGSTRREQHHGPVIDGSSETRRWSATRAPGEIRVPEGTVEVRADRIGQATLRSQPKPIFHPDADATRDRHEEVAMLGPHEGDAIDGRGVRWQRPQVRGLAADQTERKQRNRDDHEQNGRQGSRSPWSDLTQPGPHVKNNRPRNGFQRTVIDKRTRSIESGLRLRLRLRHTDPRPGSPQSVLEPVSGPPPQHLGLRVRAMCRQTLCRQVQSI